MTEIEILRERLANVETERDEAQIALAKRIRNPCVETAVKRQEQDSAPEKQFQSQRGEHDWHTRPRRLERQHGFGMDTTVRN